MFSCDLRCAHVWARTLTTSSSPKQHPHSTPPPSASAWACAACLAASSAFSLSSRSDVQAQHTKKDNDSPTAFSRYACSSSHSNRPPSWTFGSPSGPAERAAGAASLTPFSLRLGIAPLLARVFLSSAYGLLSRAACSLRTQNVGKYNLAFRLSVFVMLRSADCNAGKRA